MTDKQIRASFLPSIKNGPAPSTLRRVKRMGIAIGVDTNSSNFGGFLEVVGTANEYVIIRPAFVSLDGLRFNSQQLANDSRFLVTELP